MHNSSLYLYQSVPSVLTSLVNLPFGMQIRPTDKLTTTSGDTGNTLTKFKSKILQNKNTVNKIMHEILAKCW